MTITILPNYELFLSILLVWWIFKGIVMILTGVTHTKKDRSSTYGMFDVVAGVLFLLLTGWVMM